MTSLTRRHLIARLGLAGCAGPLAFQVQAQPGGIPLRVIVPASAGSGQDVMVRAAQTAMARSFNRPVVVENLPSSGGIIGTQQLVRAQPDGNTIAFVSNNHVVNPSVYKKLPFDSLRDVTPISILGETPFLLVVNPAKLPVANAKEMAALIQAKPDHYNFASSGNGTILHLAAEMFVEAARLKVKHIPYKGVAPMMTDLIGGQVDFGVLAVPAVQAQVKAGTLRAVAATGAVRVPSLPAIPTLQEQGFDVAVGGWLAAIGPARLPPTDVKRLHEAIVAAWTAPDAAKALKEQENIIVPTSPEVAMATFAREQARYTELVRKIGVTLD